MKLRPPATPLITVDPYFSVWSNADTLTSADPVHWTGKPNTVRGIITVDGADFRFMGLGDAPAAKQMKRDVNALSTTYVFETDKIALTAVFTTPLLPDDLDVMTRPVSFLRLGARSLDGRKHTVSARIEASEELVLNEKGQSKVECEAVGGLSMPCVKMGNAVQNVLNRSGDDVRIDWGYLYLAVCGKDGAASYRTSEDGVTYLCADVSLDEDALVLFAYDDVKSINYFGGALPSYWNRNGKTITEAIGEAAADYEATFLACEEFSEGLFADAVRAGGKKYAEILELAFRQVIAAHKVAVTKEGEIVFISKECFSNGCAATVDVSYPSVPLFLIYCPELVRGMMRPVIRFAKSDAWQYDFAPHDAGQYPLVTGQVYGGNPQDGYRFESQMPVEECGNMLIMEAAAAVADGNISFALSHFEVLDGWVKYLLQYGSDPENQLCTDDFAGHLAHNCNLSLKAIMGVEAYAILCRMAGKNADAAKYDKEAKKMALSWCERASNGDGSFRLAFDREGTFSMKYNAVWDKLFGTKLFPKEVLQSEVYSNFKHFNPYGMPLDNRADYTKSDWLVWTATLLDEDDDFERFIEPLWKAYHHTESRVPMTDWYFTTTAKQRGFQNRTVQGGLFIKLLSYLDKMNIGR